MSGRMTVTSSPSSITRKSVTAKAMSAARPALLADVAGTDALSMDCLQGDRAQRGKGRRVESPGVVEGAGEYDVLDGAGGGRSVGDENHPRTAPVVEQDTGASQRLAGRAERRHR